MRRLFARLKKKVESRPGREIVRTATSFAAAARCCLSTFYPSTLSSLFFPLPREKWSQRDTSETFPRGRRQLEAALGRSCQFALSWDNVAHKQAIAWKMLSKRIINYRIMQGRSKRLPQRFTSSALDFFIAVGKATPSRICGIFQVEVKHAAARYWIGN
jgi:hypothetical protein